MKKLLTGLLTGVALIFAAQPALADGLPYRGGLKDRGVAVYSWTGFYIGAGVGGRWMDSDWTTTEAFNPVGGLIPFTTDPDASFSSSAFRGSGYVGFNWQVGPSWVVGLEADFGWANNDETLASRIPGLGVLNNGSFIEVNGKWDASVRARAGVLVTPTVLAYATGGVAFQRIETTATCPADTFVCNPALGTQSFSNERTRTGGTVGAGLEAMFGKNWLGRVEYRYSDFGTFSFTAIPPAPGSRFGANADLDTTTHIVNFGLAYKF
jgi:outer membrane immunogenic protein